MSESKKLPVWYVRYEDLHGQWKRLLRSDIEPGAVPHTVSFETYDQAMSIAEAWRNSHDDVGNVLVDRALYEIECVKCGDVTYGNAVLARDPDPWLESVGWRRMPDGLWCLRCTGIIGPYRKQTGRNPGDPVPGLPEA